MKFNNAFNGAVPLIGLPKKLLLIMRLTTFIMIIALAQVSAKGLAQKITLNTKNTPIEKVLQSIRDQSGYEVIYETKELNDEIVSLNLTNATIEEAMRQVIKGLPYTFEIVNNNVVLSRKTPSFLDRVIDRFANIDVRGRVVDSTGKALEGATIKVKGKNIQVVTNASGEFYLANVEENAVLVISYLGYMSKELKAEKDIGLIRLEMIASGLDEVNVVSTGYQDIPKERATGSFDKISNKTFNQQVSTDVLSRLEATANSFLVASRRENPKGQLVIRGLSTISGPKAPLVVVNDFPYDGDINNINPNDVESITILKDAAAASVWGTRAGNGVIVIKTKAGKFNQRLNIEVNANYKISEKPDLYQIPLLNASDFIDAEIFAYGEGYYNNQFTNSNRPAVSPVVEILRKRALNEISQDETNKRIDRLRGLDIRDDLNKYMYRKAIVQQYYLNLSTGSQNLSWLFSGGYDKNVTELAAASDRLTLKAENSFKPLKNLTINTGISLMTSNSSPGRQGINLVTGGERVPIYTELADQKGNALPVIKYYRQSYIDTLYRGKLLDWSYYPLTDYQHIQAKTAVQDVLAKINVSYAITKDLSVVGIYQYERQQSEGRTLNDGLSYFTRDLINRFTQIDKVSGAVIRRVPKGEILDLLNQNIYSHQGRGQLIYNKNINRHQVSFLSGAEIRQSRNNSDSYRLYGYNQNTLGFSNIDYANSYPIVINNRQQFIPTGISLSGKTNRFVSLYANGSYTFDNRYIFSISGRQDASNLFGVNTNQKWNPLWSTGVAWNIHNEKFYSSKVFSLLKLRMTYGFSGNVDQSQSAVTILQSIQTSPFLGTPMSSIAKFNNPELRWEKVNMLNIGLDFAAFNNRITGSIEYYHKKATDLFSGSPVDYTAGMTFLTKNVASMKGDGVDIQLNTINIQAPLLWTTTLNFSYYKDKLTAYYEQSQAGPSVGNFSISGVIGRPVYSFYSYKWAGLDPQNGNPLGYLNGEKSSDYDAITSTEKFEDLKYHGTISPVVFGSFNNTFSWKGISVTASILYKFNYYFRRETVDYGQVLTRTAHSDYSKRWQKPGDEKITNVPSFTYPISVNREAFYKSSEITAERGDHIRLQYVNLAYDIKRSKYKSSPISNIQVYINASNLGILWRANKLGIDPEYNEFFNLPPVRSFAFGARLTLN